VFKICPFRFADQTGLVSVASDGSVRCALLSSCMLDARHNGAINRYVHELMRVTRVSTESSAEGKNEIGVMEVVLDTENKEAERLHQDQICRIPSPVKAMHAVDTFDLQLPRSGPPHHQHLTVFAYGGATGIIRLHTKDIKTDIYG
jgi:hypothetical protein